jgi:hypothetical protein
MLLLRELFCEVQQVIVVPGVQPAAHKVAGGNRPGDRDVRLHLQVQAVPLVVPGKAVEAGAEVGEQALRTHLLGVGKTVEEEARAPRNAN